jgi:two-component system, OmpR family, response regulator
MPASSPIPVKSERSPLQSVTPDFAGKGHILVVDDEQQICDLVRGYLTDEGFRVSVANDGAGLRNEMASSAIDLVILDLSLDHEDGLHLASELRGRWPEIGILMLTGRGETIDRIIGLEMGADDYLSKPFNLRELLARVRSVLRRATSPHTEKSGRRRRARFAGGLLDTC